MQPNFIEKILGANWRTTIAGAFAAGLAAYKEGAFSDPTDWTKWIFPVALAVFGYLVKDKQVTGGAVTQSPKGLVIAKKVGVIAALLVPAFLLGSSAMLMTGCQTPLATNVKPAIQQTEADALAALRDFAAKEAAQWLAQLLGSFGSTHGESATESANAAAAKTTAKAQQKFPSVPASVAAAEVKKAYDEARKHPPKTASP